MAQAIQPSDANSPPVESNTDRVRSATLEMGKLMDEAGSSARAVAFLLIAWGSLFAFSAAAWVVLRPNEIMPMVPVLLPWAIVNLWLGVLCLKAASASRVVLRHVDALSIEEALRRQRRFWESTAAVHWIAVALVFFAVGAVFYNRSNRDNTVLRWERSEGDNHYSIRFEIKAQADRGLKCKQVRGTTTFSCTCVGGSNPGKRAEVKARAPRMKNHAVNLYERVCGESLQLECDKSFFECWSEEAF